MEKQYLICMTFYKEGPSPDEQEFALQATTDLDKAAVVIANVCLKHLAPILANIDGTDDMLQSLFLDPASAQDGRKAIVELLDGEHALAPDIPLLYPGMIEGRLEFDTFDLMDQFQYVVEPICITFRILEQKLSPELEDPETVILPTDAICKAILNNPECVLPKDAPEE